jgi:hypothetical protein
MEDAFERRLLLRENASAIHSGDDLGIQSTGEIVDDPPFEEAGHS